MSAAVLGRDRANRSCSSSGARTATRAIFYPREVCPSCLRSDGLEWRPASGRGEIYAVSVQHSPQIPLPAYEAPYAVAVVELAEGVRMLSTIVGCDPESVTVGQSVSVTWEPLSDGRHLPMFSTDASAVA